MNPGSPEPCEGESTRKSHGEPRLIARIWLLMASHGGRLPSLTLKAGRTVGCNAGMPPVCRPERDRTGSSQRR